MDVNYIKSNTFNNVPLPLAIPPVSALGGVLFIPNMKRYERLRQQDILYVKGDKSSVSLHMVSGRRESVSTHLGNFMRYLDPIWFVRTSRSHIVNLQYIDAVTTRSVVVSGKDLPLTGAYRMSLWERLPIVRLKSD